MNLAAWSLLAFVCSQSQPENLDFRLGTLQGWPGEGFYLTRGDAFGPSGKLGACSSDVHAPGGRAKISRTFTVPDDAVQLRGEAFLALGPGYTADHRLDVVLLDEARALIPKKVLSANGWSPITGMLPRNNGKPRDYAWELTAHRGKSVTLILRDQDERGGCHIYAGGFRITTATASAERLADNDDDFVRFMLDLEKTHRLTKFARFDSKRFTALSNASDKFSTQHVKYCEIFHDLFLDHFRRKGFSLHAPKQRLMLAIFDSPDGFDAFLGQKMPSGVTGVYHTPTNRLALYDLAANKGLIAMKELQLKQGTMIWNGRDRAHYLETVERRFKDAHFDAGLSTTMHECAHQMSFNTGLLNRDGDVPVWLAEGLACYCESTSEGSWQILGSPNPLRIDSLRQAKDAYLPLETLVQNDLWLRTPKVLLGYAQSWALFRMLMEERPQAFRKYLAAIRSRRAPDFRIQDFREAFGPDLTPLELTHHAYLRDLVSRHPPLAAR
jgi:hypothetical protein